MLSNEIENRNMGCGCNNNDNNMCGCGYNNNSNNMCGCNNNDNNMCNCGFNNNDINMSAFNVENVPNMFNNMDSCEDFRETREEMMKQIKCYEFAIIELGLYLDTHPDDNRALCLHRKYARELKDLKDKYQKVYGPLTNSFPCNKWRWLEEPWPWERGNF